MTNNPNFDRAEAALAAARNGDYGPAFDSFTDDIIMENGPGAGPWHIARGKDELVLQPREFRLLEYLMKHAGQVVTRTMLLEGVWDYHFDPQTNVIDVHISRLRSKIDKGFERPLLHTIRGAGYMIRDGIR